MNAPHPLPRTAEAWVRAWRDLELPVLGSSAALLEDFRAVEDAVDARMLSEAFAADPLMCLKVLVFAARLPSSRRLTDAETMTEALVMSGIGPFFRSFGAQPTVEQRLASRPEALQGLQQVVHRARRAARFALGFAVHRMDHDAEVIHEAALLHDFAEMLLWCHQPGLAEEIAARQRLDPTLRSAAVQRELLGTTLADLQHALMKTWRLPELLVRITDDAHADSPQVKNVLLAIRLARHTSQSWRNPAVPDDITEICELLTLGEAPTRKLLAEIDG